MPANTSRHSPSMSHRRDRVRVSSSTGSRVNESILFLETNLVSFGRDIVTSLGDGNGSSDVAPYRQRDATGQHPRLQARELIRDGLGRLNPATAKRLVQRQQCLEARQPHLREKVLVVEQS